MMRDAPIVALKQVALTYRGPPPVPALQRCDLLIRRGEYVAVMGPSGSGKSTLLNVLGLLDLPSEGQYILDGASATSLREGARTALRAQRLGFVFQSFHLLPYRSALENVELGMLYAALPRKVRRRRARDQLERVGLGHRIEALPFQLSGGEQQRVAVARALASEPSLLLCDEPTGNLDTATTRNILDLLDDLHAEGLTIVAVTHDADVGRRAERLITIRDGLLHDVPATKPVNAGPPPSPRARSRLAIGDLLTEATAGVTRRAARSALTLLGTLLGVGAFVATIGLTGTAAAQVSSRFDALKATEVRIQDSGVHPGDHRPAFPADAEQRVSRLNGVEHAGVLWTVSGEHRVRTVPTLPGSNATRTTFNVMAASPGTFRAAGATISEGRPFDHFHASRGEPVALLGIGAARQLDLEPQFIGEQPALFLGEQPFTVVGILNDTERQEELLLSIIIPDGTADRLFPDDDGQRQMLISTQLGAAQQVGLQAPLALRPDDPERLVAIVPPTPEVLRGRVEGDVDRLVLLLAGVSLTIGTLGIANTTLVSVLERVKEIGIRRALGAGRRHISAQFLTESAILGTIGGLLGTSLAVIFVVGVAAARHWTAVLDPHLIWAAPLVGTATGLIAGSYPAIKAGRIQPLEALSQ